MKTAVFISGQRAGDNVEVKATTDGQSLELEVPGSGRSARHVELALDIAELREALDLLTRNHRPATPKPAANAPAPGA